MQRFPPTLNDPRWECNCRAMNRKKAILCKSCNKHRFGKDE